MINEKEYQKLKEVIQKACPDIRELKFGCMLLKKDISVEFRLWQKCSILRTELGEF